MARIEAGIFDVGGVLVSGAWYKHAVEAIAKNRNLSEDEVKNAWEKVTDRLATGQITEEEHWNQYPSGPNPRPLPKKIYLLQIMQGITNRWTEF